MSLHHLPVELLRNILGQVDTPDDLIALTTASMHCNNAYGTDITAKILKSIIAPAALPDALALAEITFTRGTPGATYDEGTRPMFPRTDDALITMWRHHLLVQKHVSLYAEWAMREIQATAIDPAVQKTSNAAPVSNDQFALNNPRPAPDQTGNWPYSCLSDSEQGRFERAFYGLELYGRIFYPGSYDDNGHLTDLQKKSITRYNILSRRWQTWEVAELYSVHEYLSRTVRLRFYELNRELVDAVAATPGVWLPAPFESTVSPTTANLIPRALKVPGENDTDMRHLASRGMKFYGRAPGWYLAQGQEWASSIVLKGLYHVDRMAASDLATFKKMVDVAKPCRREFEKEMIGLAGHVRQNPRWLPHHEKLTNNEDGRRCGTFGARTYLADPINTLSYKRERLAIMAAGLWDAERIRLPYVTDALNTAVPLVPVETVVDKEFGEKMRYDAERELEGVLLPKAEFDKIQRKFGVPP